MPEEGEEKPAFTVTDRRLSRRTAEGPSQEARKPPEPAAAAEAAQEARKEGPEPLPEADFAGFILSLANTALFHMGAVPDPAGGPGEVNLDGAKQMIDILGILQEKTRGNLTKAEEKLLSQVVTELRMHYVEVARSAKG